MRLTASECQESLWRPPEGEPGISVCVPERQAAFLSSKTNWSNKSHCPSRQPEERELIRPGVLWPAWPCWPSRDGCGSLLLAPYSHLRSQTQSLLGCAGLLGRRSRPWGCPRARVGVPGAAPGAGRAGLGPAAAAAPPREGAAGTHGQDPPVRHTDRTRLLPGN